MATINLGNIKFNWKGVYAGGTAYVIDDVVSYSGSSYICKLASTGNLPTNATYWDLMSVGGTDLTSTITTEGDILYRDGSGLQRLVKGSAADVLTMNAGATAPEWAASAGGGKVGQVVQQVYQGHYSVTAQSSWGAMPTATLTITPTATSSKILVSLNCGMGNNNWGGIRLYRNIGGAGVAHVSGASGTTDGSKQGGWMGHTYYFNDGSVCRNIAATYLDSPSTTSACVYSVYVTSYTNAATYMGRPYSNANYFSVVQPSTIWTGMEILA